MEASVLMAMSACLAWLNSFAQSADDITMQQKKKSTIIIMFLAYSLISSAQWRIGATGGATYNHHSVVNHYKSDRHYKDEWGVTFGFMGQYELCDWFGMRADLNWTMKNHRQYMREVSVDNGNFHSQTRELLVPNWYVQLPVMASFNVGGKKIRGYLNTGIYGGYWLCNGKNEFVKERDQRYDYGFVGGAGLEWRWKRNWALQIENGIYYSTKSTQKDYMRIKDPRYNTTLALQGGLCYFF